MDNEFEIAKQKVSDMSTKTYIYKPMEANESIDDLYEKYNTGYYHSIDSLDTDL